MGAQRSVAPQVMVVMTPGIQAEVPEEVQNALAALAISFGQQPGEPTWLVLDPQASAQRLEDEGRTLRVPFRRFHKKIWMIKEDWRHIPPERRRQWGVYGDVVVTILFPEEY